MRCPLGAIAILVALFGPALAEDAADIATLRARAERLVDDGRDREALAELDAILRAAPDDAEALRTRGVARWHSLDLRGAPRERQAGFEALQRSLCAAAGHPCAEVDLALADLGRAIELSAGARRAGALSDRAAILLRRGDAARASHALDDAIRLSPGEARFRLERAAVCEGQGDLAGARADLDEAVRLAPGDGSILLRRAGPRRRQGDADGARADLDLALQRPPSGTAFDWMPEALRLRRAVARPGDRPAWKPK